MSDSTKSQNRKSRRRRLTQFERIVEERLDRFTLASGQNLDAFHREDLIERNRTLAVLNADGLVGGMDAGTTRRRQPRYWTIDRSRGWDPENPQPKYPALVSALVTRLALGESTYFIIEDALSKDPRRRLLDFHWRFESVIDATARFNDGWMAFMWSGIWQTQKALVKQLRGLANNLREWDRPGRLPYPGKLCIIVPDHWQAELVRRAARMTALDDICLTYVAGESSIDDDYDLSGSHGRPPRPDMARSLRPPDRLDSLMALLMGNENARDLLRFLTTVEQWPGVSRAALRNLTRLNGKSTSAAEKLLMDLDLVWRTSRGGFGVGPKWLSIAARRDRVWSGRPGKSFGREKVEKLYAGRLARHEKGVADLAGRFAAAGCPVANGWRFRDVMGEQGQVAPDAMVYAESSPFGPTWFYLEYELSRTSETRVAKKCRGYLSDTRSDDFPVMVACRRIAVPRFMDQGGDRMLIAPVEDLRKGNVVGDAGTVWLHNGRPVRRLGK